MKAIRYLAPGKSKIAGRPAPGPAALAAYRRVRSGRVPFKERTSREPLPGKRAGGFDLSMARLVVIHP